MELGRVDALEANGDGVVLIEHVLAATTADVRGVQDVRPLAGEGDSLHDDVRRIAVRRAVREELLQIKRALN
ncbi:MAG TPA: hypothetical protein VHW01_11915 [Polyangiaceae bacterium]|nr:hypothetical protein [Polyangiaceae bacterium]